MITRRERAGGSSHTKRARLRLSKSVRGRLAAMTRVIRAAQTTRELAMTARRPRQEKAGIAVVGSLSVFALRDDKWGRNDLHAPTNLRLGKALPLGLPRGNGF